MKKLSRGVMAAIAVGLASSAAAQDTPVALKFSHWVPPTHPMHAAAVAWGESIDRASNGTIKLDAQKIEINSSGPTKIAAGSTASVEASATLTVKGATVNIN